LTSFPQPSVSQNPAPKARWKGILRWIIAGLVTWALIQTTLGAIERLRQQDRDSAAEMVLLEERLSTASEVERQTLQAEIAKIDQSRLRLSTIRWSRVVLGALLYGIALIAAAVYWWRILKSFGYQPDLASAVSAHVAGHVGKYVPGKALVVILRAAGVARHQIPFSIAALAAVVETLTFMAVGAAVAGFATIFIETPRWIQLLAVAMAVGTLVPTLPPLFRPFVNRLFSKKYAENRLSRQQYTWGLMFLGWGLLLVSWLLTGASFWCIVRALPGPAGEPWALHDGIIVTAAIALAMVAGFISLLPGGAGVRELVLVTLLGPRFGLPTALAAAVVARLAFLVAELIGFALAKAYLARTNPMAAEATAAD
jgi:uncharacterized membrane protein YbhN (UPF0104 family)